MRRKAQSFSNDPAGTLVIARSDLKATVYRASSYADGAARKKDRRRCYASHIYLGTWIIIIIIIIIIKVDSKLRLP